MTKLTLVIDKSQSYLDFQKSETLNSWGTTVDEVQYVDNLGKVGEISLFGDPPPSVMVITEIDQIKSLVTSIEKAEEEGTFKSRLTSGLIILTTVARVSTKKLEAAIIRNSGNIIFAKANSKDKSNIAEKLMTDLYVRPDVKKFIVEYAGDDYESIIAVVKNLSTLPRKAQQMVSIEDMYIRMPQAPGSVPPWDIEKPLMSGNVEETIKIFRRIIKHSHYLVVLSILKNKIELAYKIGAVMSADSTMTLDKTAKSLGLANNYPFKLAYEIFKKFGIENIQWSLMELLDTESKVKGGSSADGSIIMELSLAKISIKLAKQ